MAWIRARALLPAGVAQWYNTCMAERSLGREAFGVAVAVGLAAIAFVVAVNYVVPAAKSAGAALVT